MCLISFCHSDDNKVLNSKPPEIKVSEKQLETHQTATVTTDSWLLRMYFERYNNKNNEEQSLNGPTTIKPDPWMQSLWHPREERTKRKKHKTNRPWRRSSGARNKKIKKGIVPRWLQTGRSTKLCMGIAKLTYGTKTYLEIVLDEEDGLLE